MSRRVSRPLAVAATATLLGGGLVGLGATAAHADAFTVSTSAELVEAINDANASPGADVITFAADIILEDDLPAILSDLTIVGNGHTLDGDNGYYTLESYDSALSVSQLTVTGSDSDGIYVEGGSLILDGVTVTDSYDDGVQLFGADLTVTGSDISGNGDDGLDFDSDGVAVAVSISDSRFNDNDNGGMIVGHSDGGQVEITAVVLQDNGDFGGGVYVEGGTTAEVSDVVVDGNAWAGFGIDAGEGSVVTATGIHVTGSGGTGFGLYAWDGSQIELRNSSSTGNDGDGLYLEAWDGAQIDILNSSSTGNGEDGMYLSAYDDSLINLLRVDVSGNGADGIDVDEFESSTLTVVESTVSDSEDTGFEARDLYGSSQVTIERSTISGNSLMGADLRQYDGARVDILNSTISGNGGVESCVGGIEVDGEDGTVFTLAHSTVYENYADLDCPQLGILRGGVVDISHSIIAGTDWDLAVGIETDVDFTIEWSIIGNGDLPVVGTSDFVAAADLPTALASDTNLLGVDPGLEPLADNGGPTQTHLLTADSVALDAGDPAVAGAPATDQRGELRIAGDAIDIGAVEMPEPEETLPATGATPVTALAASILLLLLGGVLLAARRARMSSARG